ncbi:MAG: sigma-70 family RNA polymerase sigma factor, partial [Planctomycetes bacterium]|nr:sigma-70 family RNA polymerase sigma factor [Planctomycetota bacterium]
MTAHPGDILVSSRRWLRALALGLLGDEDQADDAVQEALVSAMSEPDASRGRLASLLRRAIWIRERGDARRRRREWRAARPEALPTDADLAERLETQARVAAAVQRLPEPYRRSVLLRYVEGLSASEIATRSGVSASAIRSRLQRALVMLRRDLDEDFGDRRRWSVALVPIIGHSGVPVAAVGTLTTGGWILVMKKAIGAAVLLLLLLVGGYWGQRLWVASGTEGTSRGSAELASSTSPRTDDERAGTGASRVTRPEAGDLETQTPDVVVDDTRDAGPDTGTPAPAIVRGHIWRTDGVSLAGSRVVLYSKERPGSVIDEEGKFRIETDIDIGVPLFLDHDGYLLALECDVHPVPGAEVVVDIPVDPGHELRIEVIDAVTRRPIVDEPVAVRRATNEGQANLVFRKTDDDGFVHFALLPDADYTLDIDIGDYKPVNDRFHLPGTSELRVELELSPMVEIVLENYAAYPPQRLVWINLFKTDENGQIVSSTGIGGKPDEDGRLTCKSPGTGRWSYDLAGGAGFARASGAIEIPESEGIPTVNITLPPVGDVTVVGRIVDDAGDPIGGGSFGTYDHKAPVADDGTFRLEGLRPGPYRGSWTRGEDNDRIDRSFDTVDIPDSPEVELTFEVRGRSVVNAWFEGLPEEF